MSILPNRVSRARSRRARFAAVIAASLAPLAAALPAVAQQDEEVTEPESTELPPVIISAPPPSAPAAKPSPEPNSAHASAAPRHAPPQRAKAAARRPTAPLPRNIVVSPTATPTPVKEVASSVTVITARDLAAEQRRSVPDALSTVPGLNVVQTGGPGGLTSVFMRGTNSNHVKVLIDGIDVSDPSNSNASFDFGQLLTGDIERIEVLRGPQSGLYGADAIGGVISITTKKGDGPPKFTASTEGGSFGTFNQTIGFSGSSSIFNYAFNVQHNKSTETPVTPGNLLPPGQPRRNDYYDNYTYSTRLGADLSDSFSLNGVARYTDSTLLFTNQPSDPERSSQVDHQFFTRGEAVWKPFGDMLVNSAGVAYSNIWTRNLDPNPEPGIPARDLGERVKEDWKTIWNFLPGQKLIVGLENETSRLDTSDLVESTGNKAGFVELQASAFDRLFVAANVRHDDNDNFGGHTTYRIAPTFLITETGTKLKASYGTGFKAPTLSELFENFPSFNFFGNPNLRPEESEGYDLGVEQTVGIVSFGSTYFHNDIRDLIVTNETQTSFANAGRATTWGFENFAALSLTDEIKLRADYTFTIAKDDVQRQELLRRPKNKASLRVDYLPVPKLNLSATLVAVGSWIDGNRDFSIPRLRASPYALVNLAANYTIDERTTVFGRIDNLLDRRYQDPVGFQRPGIGAYAGIRVTMQ